MKALALALVLGAPGTQAGFIGTPTSPLSTAFCRSSGCALLAQQVIQSETGQTFTEHRLSVRPLAAPLRFGVNGEGQIQWAEVSVSKFPPSAVELPLLLRFVRSAAGLTVTAEHLRQCFRSARQAPAGARSSALGQTDRVSVACAAEPNGSFKLAAFLGFPH